MVCTINPDKIHKNWALWHAEHERRTLTEAESQLLITMKSDAAHSLGPNSVKCRMHAIRVFDQSFAMNPF